jgi:hypothetical protein
MSAIQLHDPHTISEPILVLSGLAYLAPTYIAFQQKNYYDVVTSSFLMFTTMGFHSTRYEWFFMLDCIAILNFLARGLYIGRTNPYLSLSVAYSMISYFVGMRYGIMSFDPDWHRQMMFHAGIHLSSSFAMWQILKFDRRVALLGQANHVT